MRLLLPIVAFAAGCTPCNGPDALNNTWSVFANPIDVDGDGLDGFPKGTSPINGSSVWTINWSDTAINITIDDDPFSAAGFWEGTECGNFTLEMSGNITASDDSTHMVEASGTFVFVDDAFDGVVQWTEQWSTTDGLTGDLTASVQVAATLADGDSGG